MRLGRREHSCRSFFASILETPSELRIANQSAATKMSDSRRQYSKREVNLQIFLYCIASLVFASFKAMLLILFLLRERSAALRISQLLLAFTVVYCVKARPHDALYIASVVATLSHSKAN